MHLYLLGIGFFIGDYFGIQMIDGNVTCGTVDDRFAVGGLTTSSAVQGLQLLLHVVCMQSDLK